MPVAVGARPCLGCGFCCRKARCWHGVEAYGPGDECPGLRWVEGEGRYVCSLIVDAAPEEAGRLVASLFVGEGCCAGLNSERSRLAAGLRPLSAPPGPMPRQTPTT